jgi:histone deacetylase 1/2
LTASEPYNGNDNLHVGDGKGLSISHIGHTKLYNPHRSFTLSNVLHVPAITKPLLSVQKFHLDNNVYFEFHPFLFYVKDINTNEVSSQDRVKMDYILCPGSGLPSRQFLKPIGLPASLLLLICGIVA